MARYEQATISKRQEKKKDKNILHRVIFNWSFKKNLPLILSLILSFLVH